MTRYLMPGMIICIQRWKVSCIEGWHCRRDSMNRAWITVITMITIELMHVETRIDTTLITFACFCECMPIPIHEEHWSLIV